MFYTKLRLQNPTIPRMLHKGARVRKWSGLYFFLHRGHKMKRRLSSNHWDSRGHGPVARCGCVCVCVVCDSERVENLTGERARCRRRLEAPGTELGGSSRQDKRQRQGDKHDPPSSSGFCSGLFLLLLPQLLVLVFFFLLWRYYSSLFLVAGL